jgi:hypothetical protein
VTPPLLAVLLSGAAAAASGVAFDDADADGRGRPDHGAGG